MWHDFRLLRAWTAVNESAANQLQLSHDPQAVRLYQGTGHALLELTQGLAKQFPLKKKIYYFKTLDPYFDEVLMPLAKEGYKLQALDKTTLEDPTEWVKTLAREDLFVLYGADDPLLGRYYDIENFEKAISEQAIIKIRVSHNRHFFEGGSRPAKNALHLYSLGHFQALALLGERVRPATLVAPYLHVLPLAGLDWFLKPTQVPLQNITDFEQQGLGGAQAYFSPNEHRTPDRAVLYWEDMDGHAFIERMAERMGFELLPPGEEMRLESTSLSRWGGVRTMDFLKEQGLSPNQIRGLVLVDRELLASPAFADHFLAVRQSVLEDQYGPR